MILIEESQKASQDQFLNTFPFEKYLDQHQGITSKIKLLETHRNLVNKIGFDGQDFIFKLFQVKLNKMTFDCKKIESLKPIFAQTEILFHSKSYLADSILVYGAASSLFLETIADSVQSKLYAKILDPKDYSTHYLITRLGAYKYHVDVPTSNFTKLYSYFMEGRWGYIWEKLTTTYKMDFFRFLVLCLASILALVGMWQMYSKKIKKPSREFSKNL